MEFMSLPSFRHPAAGRRSAGRVALLWLVVLVSTLVGCGKTAFENTSPIQPTPSVPETAPIATTVSVVSKTGEDATHVDVRVALAERNAFERVVGPEESAPCLLRVESESTSDGHFGAEMLGAVASGLTLGLAGLGQTDRFDYSVVLSGSLECRDRPIGTYEAVGSYASAVPESSPLATKSARVQETVLKSWEHALAVLATEILADRAAIEAAVR